MKVAKPQTSTIHACADAALLESSPAADSIRGEERERYPGDAFNAAIGIKNGLIGGIAFWTLAYLLVSLFTSFT